MPSLAESVLELIAASELPIKEIASKANVPYQNLRRWVKGQTGQSAGRIVKSFDVKNADAVYLALTGKTYVEGREA